MSKCEFIEKKFYAKADGLSVFRSITKKLILVIDDSLNTRRVCSMYNFDNKS